MYKILKSFLFLLDAEKAHNFTTKLISLPLVKSLLRNLYSFNHDSLEKEVFGLKFKNPVGLAAGFDKDGKYIESMSSLGFGFLEIGTVTPLPQEGNPKPRLFRLKKDEALINRMGFNNDGVDALVERLKKIKKTDVIIGGNIGKNKLTPNEKAVDDYVICFEKLFDHVDYFVVNVSSPNTPGLRDLQDKGPLLNILNTLQKKNRAKANQKPILLKIAPDLNNHQLDDIVEIVKLSQISGVVATNTTIERSGLNSDSKFLEAIGNGGLSGKPIASRSTEVIRYIYEKSKGSFPIIGVGGIYSEQSAREKLDAGASLVQLYSGFIYEGPSLIKRINSSLVN